MGLAGPGGGDAVVANSAFPETMREGDGSGLTLDEGNEPRLATVTMLALAADISTSGVSRIGAVEGVCESSSVGWVANFR